MAQLNWQDLSEIVFGHSLIGDKSCAPDMIRAGDICDPYSAGLDAIKKEKKANRVIDVAITTIGLPAVEVALSAAERTVKIPANWAQLLSKAAEQHKSGTKLERMGKAMSDGREIDVSEIIEIVQHLESGIGQLTCATDVEPETDNFMPIGFKPFDDFIGGLPKSGLTIIGAPPGVGKSWLLISIMLNYIRKLIQSKQDGNVVMFTLEMSMRQMMGRMVAALPNFSEKEKSRLFFNEEIMTMADIATAAARAKANGAKMIGIDYLELSLMGDTSEPSVSKAYLIAANTAKRLQIPLILVAALNRQYVYANNGGIPKLTDLRGSAMAEYAAGLVCLIYNPSSIWSGNSVPMMTNGRQPAPPVLEIVPGMGYVIEAKSRFGFLRGGVGAIQMPFVGESGWQDRPAHWFPMSANDIRE